MTICKGYETVEDDAMGHASQVSWNPVGILLINLGTRPDVIWIRFDWVAKSQ